MSKISGAEYPLSRVFSADFKYIIPPYQRPYAWTEEHTSELFEDLHNHFEKEREDSYFLGSIVLIKEEGKPHSEVIDGQQRLTTLTLLLAAMAFRLPEKFRKNLEEYIVGSDVFAGSDSQPRLTLRGRDRCFFEKYVQNLDFEGLAKRELASNAQQNIQKNCALLLEKLDESFKKEDELVKFGQFLVQRCVMVVVSTPSQDSAFRVFSILNNRGLSLQVSDILKADIIGNVKDPLKEERFTKDWEDLEEAVGRDSFSELFSHIRMIYKREKAQRSVRRELRESVLAELMSSEDYVAFFEDKFLPYAKAFSEAKRLEYGPGDEAEHVNRLLGWLNRVNNSDWLPPAILFLSRSPRSGEARSFFSELERLTAYLHICGKGVGARIKRYARVIEWLEKNPHPIDNLMGSGLKLTESEIEEMRGVLNGQVYQLTGPRRGYLVSRLNSFLTEDGVILDPKIKILTIEHVLPQNPGNNSWERDWPDAEEREEWTHRLANLVLLTRRKNAAAQNYDFERKKSVYFSPKGGVAATALTVGVVNERYWTPQVVKQRQRELLAVLYKHWRLR